KFEKGVDGEILLVYEHPFTWSQDILVSPEAKPGTKTLDFLIDLQVCDKGGCTPGKHPFKLNLEVTAGPAVPLTDEIKQRVEMKFEPKIVTPPADAVPGETSESKAGKKDETLWGLLAASMGAAALMLL